MYSNFFGVKFFIRFLLLSFDHIIYSIFLQVGKDDSVTEEKFRTLLRQLFDGGITQDKIVVLFVFCADVAVASLKKEEPAVDLCVLCLKWAVKFMGEYVCGWVQQHGGWVGVMIPLKMINFPVIKKKL